MTTPLTDAAFAKHYESPALCIDELLRCSSKLERTVAEARAALAVIVTHAGDPHDGFTYSEIADYASKAIARLDGSKP